MVRRSPKNAVVAVAAVGVVIQMRRVQKKTQLHKPRKTAKVKLQSPLRQQPLMLMRLLMRPSRKKSRVGPAAVVVVAVVVNLLKVQKRLLRHQRRLRLLRKWKQRLELKHPKRL